MKSLSPPQVTDQLNTSIFFGFMLLLSLLCSSFSTHHVRLLKFDTTGIWICISAILYIRYLRFISNFMICSCKSGLYTFPTIIKTPSPLSMKHILMRKDSSILIQNQGINQGCVLNNHINLAKRFFQSPAD